MAFNTGQTFKDMQAAARLAAAPHWDELAAAFDGWLDQQRDNLREIAADWIRDGLSDKVLDDRLEALQQQLVGQLQQGGAADGPLCDRVAQAALTCFWDALMKGL
ncbi:MAG: hypothetical protein AB7T15_02965 [Desulfuromonas sp.]|uniref:hypothetical protein n=1 Tax=Desulfuromonas thiophila TaxID=57664 RepID=UPI0024A97B92|nr:hypothetical protein [Desulfuromonas thiophila]MDD3800599.1 hypothetical protein [Desulfuromonas thiophila]MDY0398148.1 hypothetical protein [Desulfuromonas thiophila]